MLTALIAPVTAIVVSTSAGVAVDSAVKMLVPVGIKALPAFGIKLGTAIVGGLIGAKLASIVTDNIAGVTKALNAVDHEDTDQEDN